VTVRRLNRYEFIQIRRLSSIENFVSERDDFIFNSFRNFKPVKRFHNRSDVLEFWSLDNSSNKSILDALETIYLKFRKTIDKLKCQSRTSSPNSDGGGVKACEVTHVYYSQLFIKFIVLWF